MADQKDKVLQQVSGADLKHKSIRGGAVTMGAQGASILVQLVSTVVLSRLLPAEDFGIIAMIVAVTAFVGLFKDMGLSTASIQKVNLAFEQVNTLFWINAIVGLTLTLVVAACSPLVAWFYDRADLKNVTILLSTTFLISSLGAQHAALMQRDLRFLPKAFADVLGAVTTLIVAITLALKGYGYWSLAWGTVSGAAVTTSCYFLLSKFRPGKPGKFGQVRELIGFGASVTAFEFVNYFHRNLDNVLIGRMWGAASLGVYSRAYQLMMLPITSLRTPINAVAFPVLSRLQHEPKEFRRYYRQIASLLAFLSIPLMAFLTANADLVVKVALGEKWTSVVPIFVLLGLTGLIQPVASLRGLVLLSLGRTKRYLAWGVMNAVAVSIGFCIGVLWGNIGVAASYAIVNYLILYPSLRFAFDNSPLRTSDFFTTIARPTVASIPAAALSIFATNVISLERAWQSLTISALTYITVFAATFMITPGGIAELRSYIRIASSIRNKNPGDKTP